MNKYKELLKTQNKRIINIIRNQCQLLKQVKESAEFFESVFLSRSIFYFRMNLYKFVRKHPVVKKSTLSSYSINPTQDGPLVGLLTNGGGQKAPSPRLCKIRHTYPTLMKLGTVVSFPKKIQKIHKSSDTPLEFCWHQHFLTGNQQFLLYQEIQL